MARKRFISCIECQFDAPDDVKSLGQGPVSLLINSSAKSIHAKEENQIETRIENIS